MIKKTFFILSILALITILLSCVSAVDIDNNATATIEDLAGEINLTDVGETLNLEHDYKSTSSSNQIIISKSITIDGNNHTIDTPDVSRVFLVNADNVCIKNLNFINSKTTGLAGGVISWWGNNGTLSNCNFENNSASSGAGAVLWKGNDGCIENCNFINNNVGYGPAVSLTSGESFDPSQIHIQVVNSEGGALYLQGYNILVNNCNFSNNVALLNGGAICIHWYSNVTILNSRFKNNSAAYYCGAIHVDGDNATIIGCEFENNTQKDLLLNSKALIINSTFDYRSSIEDWYNSTYVNVTFRYDNPFDELSCKINNTPEGGVLVLDRDYTYCNGSINGILISKRITIDGNGHILNGNCTSRIFKITADNVVIKNINFINGNAIGHYFSNDIGGGAIFWNGSDGNVENCNFTNNRQRGIEDDFEDEVYVIGNMTIVSHVEPPVGGVTSGGGAIRWLGSNGTILDCIFKENGVDYPNPGGAVYWIGDNVRILNSKFINNSAWYSSAIIWYGITGYLNNSILINDNENEDIFADQILSWGFNGTIANSIILESNEITLGKNTTANNNFWGDTIKNPNSSVKPDVDNWILLNLTADKEFVRKGGEVTVFYDLNTLTDKNNKLSFSGLNCSGEIKLTAIDTGIVNVTFSNNKIDLNIIHKDYDDFNKLRELINNTPEGGLLVLDRDYIYTNGTNKGILINKTITIDGNGHTINGNHTSRMFNISADDVIIKNINFINGNAYGKYFSNDAGGGAIYWNGANGYIENCNFTNNTGRGLEYDPFEKEVTFVDENGTVWQSISMRPMGAKINEGGAIVWNGTNGTVSKCIFKTNSVGYPNYGGAICWRGDSGNVLESEFYNNDAWAGAAICWIGDNGTILYSKFVNSGSIFGRDIMWFGKNGNIRYSFLISDYGSPIYPYSENVNADGNFWGDTLDNPNESVKIEDLNNWIVLNATYNKNFIHKGDLIVVNCNLLLFGKDGNISNFTALNIPGNITAKADKDGFVQLTFDDGKIGIKIVPKTKIVSKDLTKYYKQSKQFKVRVYGADGKLAIGKNVKFTVGKSTVTVKTDKKGYATFKFNKKPGKYTVYTKYEDVKVKNKIVVKTVLVTKNVSKKVKKTGKFTVKTLNSKGKAVKNKVVKIKFKGKTYKIKSNKKGMATFNLPKNLKVGKYSIKTTYNGLTNTNKIIVKK